MLGYRVNDSGQIHIQLKIIHCNLMIHKILSCILHKKEKSYSEYLFL